MVPPLAAIRATRLAVGDDIALMADLNQWWRMPGDLTPALDLAAVRRIAAELADLGVLWLEEPLPAGDLDGMRALRAQIRVAGGEMARTPAELLAALDADALDVLQPDVVLSVGLLRARTLGELALLRHRWFTPHTWTNGLGLLANLHVAAGVGGGPYLEFPYDPPGWTPERRDFFLTDPLRIDPKGSPGRPRRPGPGRPDRPSRRNPLRPLTARPPTTPLAAGPPTTPANREAARCAPNRPGDPYPGRPGLREAGPGRRVVRVGAARVGGQPAEQVAEAVKIGLGQPRPEPAVEGDGRLRSRVNAASPASVSSTTCIRRLPASRVRVISPRTSIALR